MDGKKDDKKDKILDEENFCPYRVGIRNCFLEHTIYCMNYGSECVYKRHIPNADGDKVEVCTKDE